MLSPGPNQAAPCHSGLAWPRLWPHISNTLNTHPRYLSLTARLRSKPFETSAPPAVKLRNIDPAAKQQPRLFYRLCPQHIEHQQNRASRAKFGAQCPVSPIRKNRSPTRPPPRQRYRSSHAQPHTLTTHIIKPQKPGRWPQPEPRPPRRGPPQTEPRSRDSLLLSLVASLSPRIASLWLAPCSSPAPT